MDPGLVDPGFGGPRFGGPWFARVDPGFCQRFGSSKSTKIYRDLKEMYIKSQKFSPAAGYPGSTDDITV